MRGCPFVIHVCIGIAAILIRTRVYNVARTVTRKVVFLILEDRRQISVSIHCICRLMWRQEAANDHSLMLV